MCKPWRQGVGKVWGRLSWMVLLGGMACTADSGGRFITLPGETSGLEASNLVTPSVDFSILDYPYFYNGGGVAVADFDQDGWQDVFVTLNQQENRLYRNEGNLRFSDQTAAAGVGGPVADWSTGVSVADVNADGLPDLYVCYLSGELGRTGRNRLYLNEGNFRFREAAAEFGLDLRGMATQAAFFDYDRDGDLDCFLLQHSVRPAEVVQDTALRRQRDPYAGDRLLRNDNGQFVDVSATAGISGSRLGYGLNVLVNDWNGDGWPDLYVCNDFQEDDYFYLNQGDGSFREALRDYFGHTSRFSMGSDMADVNGDGQADLLTLDMKPQREDILKTAEAPEDYDSYRYKLSFGYYHQFPRNALQVSQGGQGFSDLSQLAGIDATDWSWSALFADYDLDGWQDLYITNGILRRPNDMDYIKFLSDPVIARELAGAPSAAHLRFIERMPSIPLVNPLLRRVPDSLRFVPAAEAWGLDQPGFSNGAAYADFDRDGDLDLIVNNLQAPLALHENRLQAQPTRWLQLDLRQPGANPFALGAQVTLFAGGDRHQRQLSPVRGFQSCVGTRLHLSWQAGTQPDSLHIRWPDGAWTRLTDLPADTIWTLPRAATQPFAGPDSASPPAFTSKPLPETLTYHHREDDFVDVNREPLMPHLLSREGPAVAMTDLNGDGHPDWYLGGAAGQPAQLLLSTGADQYREQPGPWLDQAAREDVDATFVDVNGDGRQDLYLVSGGNAFAAGDARYQDRLYLQSANGWQQSPLPVARENGAVVAPADFDADGDIDLFVGSRSVPGSYGLTPASQLLINDGQGRFARLSTPMDSAGMITGAVWLDWEQDGDLDLILAGEWMPLQLWLQTDGSFQREKAAALANTAGWWQHLQWLDMDGDGDMDLLAGNLGLNSDLRASTAAPCSLYVHDFDGNGSTDPILCATRDGKAYPYASRDELLGQLAYLRRRFTSYQSYAEVPITQIFSEEQLQQSIKKSVQTFESIWLRNDGNGAWSRQPLPEMAQVAPIFAAVAIYAPKQRWQGVILAGNFYGVEPRRGRYDALKGLWLGRDGRVRARSGLWLPGETRHLLYWQNELWGFRNDAAPLRYAFQPGLGTHNSN